MTNLHCVPNNSFEPTAVQLRRAAPAQFRPLGNKKKGGNDMNSKTKCFRSLGLVFCFLCLFSSFGATTAVANQSFVLGFAHGRPAIYFSPQAGMDVQLMNITYDTSGQAAAYDMEVLYPPGKKFFITIRPGAANTERSADYRYKTIINGEEQLSIPLSKWKHTKTNGMISFYPEGMGGSILRFEGRLVQKDVNIRYSYDSNENRSIASESFSCEGIYYEFEYSEHRRNDSGQLLGYKATVVSIQKKETK